MLPILKGDTNYIPSKEEFDFIGGLEYNFVQANNNFLSKDYYVLQNKSLASLRSVVEQFINRYKDEVIGMNQDLVITQSWIARTLVGGHHSMHYHPNSLFSGVFYIDCSDNSPLNFYHGNLLFNHFKFDVDYNKETVYNRTITSVDIKPSQMVMFPSWIEHDVNVNAGPMERVVLAFNTFIRGDLGSTNFYPTGLKIN